jgi:enterochelin esterase family protein
MREIKDPFDLAPQSRPSGEPLGKGQEIRLVGQPILAGDPASNDLVAVADHSQHPHVAGRYFYTLPPVLWLALVNKLGEGAFDSGLLKVERALADVCGDHASWVGLWRGRYVVYQGLRPMPMGAGQALRIGLAHLDTFTAIGAFSGVGRVDPKTAYDALFADPAAFDKKVSLLYLHAGTVGLDEGIHRNAESLYNTLDQAGIKHIVFRDAQGFAHEWQTWRHALHDFAPRLFQQAALSSESNR